jgi:oxalate decarboxylase family bicupin protein
MGLSHNRAGLNGAGWARQQNVHVLPGATDIAGVDMRLSPHAYREIHWHKANEWAFIFNGSVRIQASDENGKTTIDDLSAGDVWFFPAGIPHSVQAFDKGAEFLLVFDDGSFSEDNTFLASELFLRNPKSVLAKNLRTDISAFDNISQKQLWIFNGTAAPADISAQNITGASGTIPIEGAYSYHLSKQEPFTVPGGSIKVIDPTTFPVASMFSVALLTIKPGAMREIHWHQTSDEWNFFMAGTARVTVFEAPANSRTFDFQAGDVGYVPVAEGHYIENVGEDDVVMLEVLKAPKFTGKFLRSELGDAMLCLRPRKEDCWLIIILGVDMSMGQWLGLTPPQIVKDTLRLPDDVIAKLPKHKQFFAPGSTNITQTNFTGT